MAKHIWTCLNIFGLILLARAQANTSEVLKTTLLVSDASNTTEQSIKTNESAKKQNETFDMQPITQPIAENHSPTQQIGRTLLPVPVNTSNNQQKSDTKPTNFRPSQQLDTYFEYNRFPVVPAFPEAKHFSGINLQEKPIRSETLPWLDRPITNYPTTTQQPWYNRINFPTTQNPYLSVRDHPYPYLITGYPETTTRSQYPYVITGTNPPDTTTRVQYPYVITGTNHETTTRNPGYGQGFSKFGGFPAGNSAQQGFNNKFGGIFDRGSIFDKGSLFGGKGGSGAQGGGGGEAGSFLQKTNFEQSNPLAPSGGAASASPWKKIIKFLTAVIPIGLLLSALTPTVINVSPMNMTHNRGRAEQGTDHATKQLISSLNYINKLNSQGCEERVICEILMGAGASANAEKHVENLLEAFTEQERDVIDQIEELKKIFHAVKTGSCSSLACDKISEKPSPEDEVAIEAEPKSRD